MNIFEAVKTGKPFRRKSNMPRLSDNRGYGWLGDFDPPFDWIYEFSREDILADDWEVWEVEEK